MKTRRSTLLGVGQLFAGAGALRAGAFDSQTQADSEFRVIADAPLTLTPARPDDRFVTTDEQGQVTAITVVEASGSDGANTRARTRFNDLVRVTNNRERPVAELYFDFQVSDDGLEPDDPTTDQIGNALQIVSEDDEIEASGDTNYFDISADDDVQDGELNEGESVSFGIQLDLLPNSGSGSISTLPDPSKFSVDLTIEALLDE